MVVPAWSLDWSMTAALAGVTLLEGIRRVPAGSVVVMQLGWEPWTITARGRAGLRLISWAAPLVLHWVLPPADTVAKPRGIKRRWRRLRRWLPPLRVAGTAEALMVVFGIPLATGRWGPFGLLLAAGLAFQGAVFVLILSTIALEEIGVPHTSVSRTVLGLLSPFAAPRAAEVVAETALTDVPPLCALQLLLSTAAFAERVRPRAYDVVRQSLDDAELLACVPRAALEAIVTSPPPSCATGEQYCPRCGTVYQARVLNCGACDGVMLSTSVAPLSE